MSIFSVLNQRLREDLTKKRWEYGFTMWEWWCVIDRPVAAATFGQTRWVFISFTIAKRDNNRLSQPIVWQHMFIACWYSNCRFSDWSNVFLIWYRYFWQLSLSVATTVLFPSITIRQDCTTCCRPHTCTNSMERCTRLYWLPDNDGTKNI